jgi:hypothetical protein
MKNFIRIFIAACYLSVLGIAQAATPWFNLPQPTVSLGASTLGGGVGIGFHDPGAKLGIRISANLLHFGFNVKDDDARTKVQGNLQNESILIDVYPWAVPFHLTAGVVFNQNSASVTSSPQLTGSLLGFISHAHYHGVIGDVRGPISFNPVDPYLGIGYCYDAGAHWQFSADIGAMYEGNGRIALSPNGLLATDPAMRASAEASARKADNDINKLSFYPIIGFAVAYRF